MLKKRLNSFRYAFQGIIALFRAEANAKVHLTIAVLVVVAGFVFSISIYEWYCIIFAIVLVFAAEALNTAIEKLTDLVSPDHHHLAGQAKDLAAGAVLILAIGAAIVGGIIFLPKLLAYLSVI